MLPPDAGGDERGSRSRNGDVTSGALRRLSCSCSSSCNQDRLTRRSSRPPWLYSVRKPCNYQTEFASAPSSHKYPSDGLVQLAAQHRYRSESRRAHVNTGRLAKGIHGGVTLLNSAPATADPARVPEGLSCTDGPTRRRKPP